MTQVIVSEKDVDKRGYSSAGRALAWHARGQRFDPAYLHQNVKFTKFRLDK